MYFCPFAVMYYRDFFNACRVKEFQSSNGQDLQDRPTYEIYVRTRFPAVARVGILTLNNANQFVSASHSRITYGEWPIE